MKTWMSLLCALTLMGSLAANVSAHAAPTEVEVEQPVPRCGLVECHGLLKEQMANSGQVAVPDALVHCETTADVGYYRERLVSSVQVGQEVENCMHNVVGNLDIRYQYLDTYESSCTLCSYTATFGELRWSGWNCTRG